MNSAVNDPINNQEDTLIERTPCRIKSPVVKTSRDALNAEISEIKIIYEAMPPRLQLAIYLAGVMGLRIGEILALQRCDIDLDAGTLHVSASIKPAFEGDR